MQANPFLGVALHALGGLAAASFYIPFTRIRKWAWESYWIIGGVFSWIIAPWVVTYLKVPEPLAVLSQAPIQSMALSFGFGALWGVGGLMFGLSMRYLGMSLGYALALGFCAAFGTIIPPLFQGKLFPMFTVWSGLVILFGIAVCLLGIAICGLAGISKERTLSDEQKKATIHEFNFSKGVWIATICGIMSACMAFGIAAGKPIAELAVKCGTPNIWQNTPVFIVIFAGGFATNLVWCTYLNVKNRTGSDYLNPSAPLHWNYVFAALAGITWYLQFMFYGMGETQMTRGLKFSSWTLHMAFIIVFSNLWAIGFKEWRGTDRKTHSLIIIGILVLIASTIILGLGNKLAEVP